MKKKIVTFMVCISLIINFCIIDSEVVGAYNKQYLMVITGKTMYRLSVIYDDGEIYMRGKDLAEITRHTYMSDEESVDFIRGIKNVHINIDDKYLTYDVDLLGHINLDGDIISSDGEYYLPSSEILPWLNAYIGVKEGDLIIGIDEVSSWEVIEDLELEYYHCDISKELEKADINKGLVTLDTFVNNLSLDKITHCVWIPGTDSSYGNYKVYYNIFNDMFMDSYGSHVAYDYMMEQADFGSSLLKLFEKTEVIELIEDDVTLAYLYGSKGINYIKLPGELAMYTMHMQNDHSLMLSIAESISLKRLRYEISDGMQSAMWDIQDKYSSIVSGYAIEIRNYIFEQGLEVVISAGTSKAIDLIDTVLGVNNTIQSDWASEMDNMGYYEKIYKLGENMYNLSSYSIDSESYYSSHRDDINHRLNGLMLYTYYNRKSFVGLQKYFIKEGKKDIANSYSGRIADCDLLYARLVLAKSALENDSYSYGEGMNKEIYESEIRDIYNDLEFDKEFERVNYEYQRVDGSDQVEPGYKFEYYVTINSDGNVDMYYEDRNEEIIIKSIIDESTIGKVIHISVDWDKLYFLTENHKMYVMSGFEMYDYDLNIEKPELVMENVAYFVVKNGDKLILTNESELYGFGSNESGKFRIGADSESNFVLIDTLVSDMALGDGHILYIKGYDDLFAMGNNHYGQLGIGSIDEVNGPVKIMSDVISIDANDNMSAAITSDNRGWLWGKDIMAEMNMEYEPDDSRPTPEVIMEDCKKIILKWESVYMINFEDKLYGMGKGQKLRWVGSSQIPTADYAILTTPSLISRNVADYSSGSATYFLKTNGSVFISEFKNCFVPSTRYEFEEIFD